MSDQETMGNALANWPGFRRGAIGAILDEYERALREYIGVLEGVSSEDFERVLDTDTKDDDCRSIQTISRHVIGAGYGYAVTIRRAWGEEMERPATKPPSPDAVISELEKMFQFNLDTFRDDPADIDQKMEETHFEVSWGETYTPEQLMEHAIVHVLRHRRQIQKFVQALSSTH